VLAHELALGGERRDRHDHHEHHGQDLTCSELASKKVSEILAPKIVALDSAST
jgi:hypothetical protein